MSTKSNEPAQLTLGLPDPREPSEAALRRAHAEHCAHGLTFEEAMRKPALALCLKNIARGHTRWQRSAAAEAVAAALNHPKEPA